MRFAVLVLVFLGFIAPVQAAKRVALVIGNSAYVHANPLANPKNDAEDVAKKLATLGFDVTSGQNLDLNKMRDTVRGFIKNLESADLAVFYYAGHGLQVKGANYMVPIDAKLATEDDVGFEAISMDTVLGPMERVSRTNLVFLDACRDNPLAKNLARSMGTRSSAIGQGLAQQGGGVGTLIAFSTQPGNVALDGKGRNSPFTAALLKHLGTPGQDIMRDMVMVRRDVIATTNGAQVPWDNSSLTGDVVLRTGDKDAAELVPPLVIEKKVVSSDRNAAVASIETSPPSELATPLASGESAFDGRWSLKRTAKKGICGWTSIFDYIEIANGKIDIDGWQGTVKENGTLNLILNFGDNITSEKGRNILKGKMTPDGGNGKFFKPNGECKGAFSMVRN